jgi:lipooligosaccharide transport system ATP-binding protein
MQPTTSNHHGWAVEVAAVSKRYGERRAVDVISARVPSGSCTALLGSNGAGKSTLLRLLSAMTRPDEGGLRVLGLDPVHNSREVRSRIGVVPQDDSLDLDFTVTQNLLSYACFFGLSRCAARERVRMVIDRFGLAGRESEAVGSLSGGYRRRVSLARALLNDPQLVLLDEPTTGLDPGAREMLWTSIRSLIADGRTIIMSTHYLEEAELLCDRVMILVEGHIVVDGSLPELLSVGADSWTRTGDAPTITSVGDAPPRGSRRSCELEEIYFSAVDARGER